MIYINNNKLNSFKLTDDNFFVVIDFDRTISTSDSMGSWSVFENPDFMPIEFKERAHALMEKYYPYEIDYTIDNETKLNYMQEWYIKNMNLIYEYGLTYEILLKCVTNSNIKFRNGFTDFFHNLYKKNIPVIILSAGIGNVIVELLKLHNCYYDNVHIISNFIKFENNLMLPFNDNMIHSLNKNLDFSKFDKDLLDKDYIILLGDLIDDLDMVPKNCLDRTISFGFLETNVEKNFDLYRKYFDVVLTENSSFNDVRDVLEKYCK